MALALALSACGKPAESPRARAEPPAAWTYAVTAAPDLSLEVDATFSGPIQGDFVLDEEVSPFIRDVVAVEGASPRPVVRTGARVQVLCIAGCHLAYHVALGEAGSRLADPGTALTAGSAVFSPLVSFLVRPDVIPERGRYRLEVNDQSGVRFVTGLRPTLGHPGVYEAELASFRESTFAALGTLRLPAVGDGRIVAAVAPGVVVPDSAIAAWLGTELSALDGYLGRFPEDRVAVFVAPAPTAVVRGVTRGGGGASIVMRLPEATTTIDLGSEWVAAHELLHAGFPQLDGNETWFSEGYASYVEPFARARAGLTTPERVWADLMDGLPQGLPSATDRGLDYDESWGRTYWGGALYFLLADVAIREQSGGKRSLEDAIRAVVGTGATIETSWPLERVLRTGDAATGRTVLQDLYARFGRAPGTTDLNGLWARLGIRREAASVVFDDRAPLAEIRKQMTRVGVATPAGGKLPPTEGGEVPSGPSL